MTQIITIPTGSIIATLISILAFITFIAYKVMSYEPKKESNTIIFRLIGSELIVWAGYIILLMSFYIMKFSEPFDFYAVSKAIFVIFGIIFGVIGTIFLIPITLTLMLLFFAGAVDFILGKNGKKE